MSPCVRYEKILRGSQSVRKANRIEIYAQTADGLVLKHSKAVYGKIAMLQKLRPASSPTDHLFIGTERSSYFIVSWDPTTKQLRTEKAYVDQADKTGRDSQSSDRCLVDPTKRFVALQLFEGIITVIPIIQRSRNRKGVEIGSLSEPVPVRIPELFLRSSTFLHPRSHSPEKEKPVFATLYEDNNQVVGLRLRSLDHNAGASGEAGTAEMPEIAGPDVTIDMGASHIIPVPAPACMLCTPLQR